MKRLVHLLLSFSYTVFVLAVLVSPFILKRDKLFPRKPQLIHRTPNANLHKQMIAGHPLVSSFQNFKN